jgi:hypothetical protein
MAAVSGHGFNIGPYGKNVYIFFPLKQNTLWALAAMLDFKSAPKTQIW